MFKALLFIIYNKNDKEIANFIENPETNINQVIIFPSNNPEYKELVLNTICLTNFIKYNYYNVNDVIAKKSMRKLFSLSFKLISFFIMETDEYLIGLRRLSDKNQELSINYIAGIFDRSEGKIVDFLNIQSKLIEETYVKFYNSLVNSNELSSLIKNSIQTLFDEMKLNDYIIDTEEQLLNSHLDDYCLQNNDSSNVYNTRFYRKSNRLSNNTYSEPHEESRLGRLRILLNKTFYIYSVVKSIKILNFLSNHEISGELFNEVLKLLYFISENDDDNCMILLIYDILLLNLYVNMQQEILLIKLIQRCLKIIKKNSIKICSLKRILKFIKLSVHKAKVTI